MELRPRSTAGADDGCELDECYSGESCESFHSDDDSEPEEFEAAPEHPASSEADHSASDDIGEGIERVARDTFVVDRNEYFTFFYNPSKPFATVRILPRWAKADLMGKEEQSKKLDSATV